MLNKGKSELLFRVRRYELFREDGRLSIELEETVAGTSDYRFYAVPAKAGKLTDNSDYMGVGETEMEALQDFLRKINGVPQEEIVPASVFDEAV
jgi:hypothetical protein